MSIATWVLILTMSGRYDQAATSAIDHIPGFASKRECQEAGNDWYRDQLNWMLRDNRNTSDVHVRYSCVSQIIPSIPMQVPR